MNLNEYDNKTILIISEEITVGQPSRSSRRVNKLSLPLFSLNRSIEIYQLDSFAPRFFLTKIFARGGVAQSQVAES